MKDVVVNIMIKILIVEDQINIRKLYQNFLSKNGYEVFEASDGLIATDMMLNVKFDMILMDVMMPNMDGYELSEWVRENFPEMPQLMITARGQLDDKLTGFRKGVDDYIVKPIDLSELLVRVQALLRRANIHQIKKIEFRDTIIDENSHNIVINSERIELPKKEFELIYKLANYPSKVFTRTELFDELWGYDSMADERTIDVHIKRLREKIVNSQDISIVTVRGMGYKLEKLYETI